MTIIELLKFWGAMWFIFILFLCWVRGWTKSGAWHDLKIRQVVTLLLLWIPNYYKYYYCRCYYNNYTC